MKTTKLLFIRLTAYWTLLLAIFIFCGLASIESSAKEVPLSLEFSFTNQASVAATPQPLRIVLDHSMSTAARCDIKLIVQAYTNVVSSSSPTDFIISATNLIISSLPSGETVRTVQISFAKDGEYRVFGTVTTDRGYAASQGFCFIVRDGKVYGSRFFDDCEGVIILNKAIKIKGGTNNIDNLQRQYDQRLQEREQIKKNIRKTTKTASGINTGQNVSILANWTGPKVTGGSTTIFPVLNCEIEVQTNDFFGFWHSFSTGYIQNGVYSFVAPADDLEFRVVFTLNFNGFGGNSKFSVKTDGILGFFGSVYSKSFVWDDAAFQRNGNQFTYTAPFHAWVDVDTDAEKFDSAWGAFHGVQEIFNRANLELSISRVVDTTVTFPTSKNVSQASGDDVYIVLGDRYDWDILAHEIGHVIDSTYLVTTGTPGGHHYIDMNQYNDPKNTSTHQNKDLSCKLSMSEAFATWFGVALLEKSQYGGLLANIGDKKEDHTEDSTFSFSLEDYAFNSGTLQLGGEDSELAIEHVIWDIHDSNDENYSAGTKSLADSMHIGLSGMWNILKGGSYKNVSDLWLNNWLIGANDDARYASLDEDSLTAAEIFVEMGMAPHLVKPDNFTKVDLNDASLQLSFQWEDIKRTGNSVLFLNQYTLVIYKEDYSIVFKKTISPATATSYSLSQADLTTLKNAVGTYNGDLIAVVFGANTPTSGSGVIKTGPYASNGVRLSQGGRYVPLVVDSSSSMSWNDPSNLRIEAAKEVCNGLVSASQAQQSKLAADKAAGVDFDDAIEAVQDFVDPPSLIPFLNGIDSSGNTRIDLGINEGVTLLENAGVAGAGIADHSAIFLFTDGENNAGDAPVIAAIDDAWSKGVRVHYGWLQPGKGGLTTYPRKSTKGIPSTIEEAVRMTGGNYGIIRDAESQLAFVNQVFKNGLTVIDHPQDNSAGGNIAGHVETPNELSSSYQIQSYRFNGQANEAIQILLTAADFDPIVSLFDTNGAYLAVDYDDDGDRSISMPVTLPYTGQYVVEVRGRNAQYGKYTLLVEVENAPPFIDVTGNTSTGFTNWVVDRSTGELVGSLILQNNTASTKTLKQKFWYVLPSTSNLRLAHPDGVDANGNPYVDVTAQVLAALPNVGNGDLNLDPGESVTITGIRFYSLNRSAPAGFIFAVWADPPPGTIPVVLPSSLPKVKMTKNSPGIIGLSWMATKGTVIVEESDNLSSTNWHAVSQPQQLQGDNVNLFVPVSTGAKFYRLRQNK